MHGSKQIKEIRFRMKSIYTIKNTVNNKIYVGKAQSPEHRHKRHLYLLRTGKHTSKSLQLDYLKYGESAFRFDVLFSVSDDAEAKRMEVFMMKVLKTQSHEYGYNDSDKSGTSPGAIASRWRIPAHLWNNCGKAVLHERHPDIYEMVDWTRKPKVNDRYA